jgi:hypothetical protein
MPGPAPAPSPQYDTVETLSEPPLSPHTTERSLVRSLTMPPYPNFDIPDPPPLPAPNSEEAARLAATTKKFERFLEVKREGMHFNERLQNSSSLRNPSLLPKLMVFAGVSLEESYATTIPSDVGGVPTKWPEECYVEALVKANERREKKRLGERGKVEFVAAKGSKSGPSSANGTPGSNGNGRKSRFDRP